MSINLLWNDDIRAALLSSEAARLKQIEDKTNSLQMSENGGLLLGADDPTKAVVEFPNYSNVSTTEYIGQENDKMKLIGKNSSAWVLGEDGLKAYVKQDPLVIPPVEEDDEPTTIYYNLFDSTPKLNISKDSTIVANDDIDIQADNDITLSAVNTLDIDAKDVDIMANVAITGDLHVSSDIQCNTYNGTNVSINATGLITLDPATAVEVKGDLSTTGKLEAAGEFKANGGILTSSIANATKITIDAPETEFKNAVKFTEDLVIPAGKVLTNTANTAPMLAFKNGTGQYKHFISSSTRQQEDTGSAWMHIGTYDSTLNTGSQRALISVSDSNILMHTNNGSFNNSVVNPSLRINNSGCSFNQPVNFNHPNVNFNFNLNMPDGKYLTNNYDKPFIVLPNSTGNPKFFISNCTDQFANASPIQTLNIGTYDKTLNTSGKHTLMQVGSDFIRMHATGTGVAPDAATAAPVFNLSSTELTLGQVTTPVALTGRISGFFYRSGNAATYMNEFARYTPHAANFIKTVAISTDAATAPSIQMRTIDKNPATSVNLDQDNFIIEFEETTYIQDTIYTYYVKLLNYWDGSQLNRNNTAISYPNIELLPDRSGAFTGERIVGDIQGFIQGTATSSYDAILKIMFKVSDVYTGFLWKPTFRVKADHYFITS